MTVKFTNNASTTVATGINTTATSLVVASAAGFPALSGSGDYCYLTIQQAAGTNVEVVKATALSSNTFTIVRAQDGTSAGSWSVSDVVELRVTAALLTDIVDAATHDSSVLSVDSTNNRVGVNDTTPSVTLDISGTDAIALPVGTTAQRPAAGAGRFRYNSSLSQFEGYTDAWGAIGGGGTNTFTTDSFTANGSLVAFNLSQTVASESNLLVFIDGVFQTQDAYAIATASGTTTLTFSAAPANGRKIVVYSVAAGISGTNLNVDSMTGDGSDTTLTLTINTIKENTQVFIDGVYQAKANYSISGTTLTFSTAPPAGSAVECVTMTQTEINVPVDGTITSAKLSGALTTPGALTVTGALAANGGAVFNEASADVDFRVESDANTHALFVDGATGNLGIGMVPPSDRNLAVYDANNSIFSLHNSTTGTSAGDGFQLQLVSDDAYLVNYEAGGIVSFYTTPSGGSTTERMRIDGATGNVGIGVSNPSDYYSNNLVVGAGSEGGITIASSATTYNNYLAFADSSSGVGRYAGLISYDHNIDAMHFRTNSLERLRIDNIGRVGVSVTPPAWGSAYATVEVGTAASFWGTKAGASLAAMSSNSYFNGSAYIARNTGPASKYYQDGGVHYWDNAASVSAGAAQTNVERMRLSSTCLSVGTTSNTGPGRINARGEANGAIYTYSSDQTPYGTGAIGHILFSNANGAVGNISTSGTTTAYATSSDYRLKENVVAMSGATERLKQLNPSRFNFIADADTTVDGFLAHEVQAVVPEAITGTKDAMKDEEYEVTPAVLDDDDNVTTEAVMGTRSVPDYQGIDQSKLVPLLVATIQELEARLTALENN